MGKLLVTVSLLDNQGYTMALTQEWSKVKTSDISTVSLYDFTVRLAGAFGAVAGKLATNLLEAAKYYLTNPD